MQHFYIIFDQKNVFSKSMLASQGCALANFRLEFLRMIFLNLRRAVGTRISFTVVGGFFGREHSRSQIRKTSPDTDDCNSGLGAGANHRCQGRISCWFSRSKKCSTSVTDFLTRPMWGFFGVPWVRSYSSRWWWNTRIVYWRGNMAPPAASGAKLFLSVMM